MTVIRMNEFDVLLGMAESLARQRAGGHLSILRFTGGWKIALRTPDLLGGRGYGEVWHLRSYATLLEALRAFLAEPVCVDAITDRTDGEPCRGFPCLIHETSATTDQAAGFGLHADHTLPLGEAGR